MNKSENSILAFQGGYGFPRGSSFGGFGGQTKSGFEGLYTNQDDYPLLYSNNLGTPLGTDFKDTQTKNIKISSPLLQSQQQITKPTQSTSVVSKTAVSRASDTRTSQPTSGASTTNNGSNTRGNSNMGTYAQVASTGANISSQAIDANTEEDPYAIRSTGQVEGITGSLGPYGALFTAISGVGASVGRNIGGGTDEYGHADNVDNYKAGSAITSTFKPLAAYNDVSDQQKYLTADEQKEFLNTDIGRVVGGFIAPMALGSQKAKNQEAIADRAETADNAKKAMEESYEESQKNIKDSEERYQRAMATAGNIYSAKKGAVIYKPYKRKKISIDLPVFKNPELIQGLQKGASIIPAGAYHHTENDFGDKGIPVVDFEGVKVFEIETDEVVFGKGFSDSTMELVDLYNSTGDEKYLEQLGNMTKDELVKNTYSYTSEYSCLNTNSCVLN